MKYLIGLLAFCLLATVVDAEDTPITQSTTLEVVSPPEPKLSEIEIKAAEEEKKRLSILSSLESTQLAIDERLKEQSALQRQFKSADLTEKASIQTELDEIALEIKGLKSSFEQVAIGGVRLEAFGLKEKSFDWKEELILVTQPIIESLKNLTEKPRNLERLRTIISTREVREEEINRAILLLENQLAASPPKVIIPLLGKNLQDWQSKKKDNLREIELAKIQLNSLLGNNEPWYQGVAVALQSFFNGRGRTLLIALCVSVMIWQSMKGLLWLIRKKSEASRSTHRRIFAYLYRFLTTLMIVIAVMVTLYVRGDLLLLALMIIVFIGLVLAVRSYLPTYIIEAKTLLDLGTVRESELVLYNGIPWQVHHVNVQSILINPEIYGVLRVPLSELVTLKSRPVSRDENWFPCQKDDFLLMPDGAFMEVLGQTPDSVELQSKGGMRVSYPTPSMFEMGFYNISRGDKFSVMSTFGIDYAHVNISLTEVPDVFQVAVHEGLKQAGLGEHTLDVIVDFKVANASSLDYIIIASMHSRAASSYFKVDRVIQQSCVRACTQYHWGIPFPQLTVHRAEV